MRLNLSVVLPLAFAFGLIGPLFYLSPIQSDDFFYAIKGISIENSISHYLGWSGRLLADTVSSAILATRNKVLVAAVNTSAVVAMIYFISALPFGRERPPQFALNFALLLAVYWLGNPALGQTTLWAVGAANYVYASTLLAAGLYLLSLEEFRGEKVSLPILATTALLAGMGNENMSVAIGFVAAAFLLWRLARRESPSLAFWVAATFYGIGSVILIFAPGNLVRQEHFQSWYDLSILEKASHHFLVRIPTSLHLIFLPIACVLFAALLAWFARRDLKPAILFALGSAVSISVMAAAPYVAGRPMNPTAILLVLSLSCLLPTRTAVAPWRSATSALLLFLTPLTVIKLPNQYVGYLSLYKQQLVRERMIKSGQTNIPAFYTDALLDKKDAPDPYHNGAKMGEYYGTSTISLLVMDYDFSKDSEL